MSTQLKRVLETFLFTFNKNSLKDYILVLFLISFLPILVYVALQQTNLLQEASTDGFATIENGDFESGSYEVEIPSVDGVCPIQQVLGIAHAADGIEEVMILPLADTFINAWEPDTNTYPSGAPYYTYSTFSTRTQNVRNSLMKFTMPDLPEDAVVTSAILYLYPTGRSNSAGTTLHAYELKRTWNNKTTWNTYDGTSKWATPGGTGTTDIYSNEIGSISITEIEKFIEIDITIGVQDWIENGILNNGLLVTPTSDSNVQYEFASVDHWDASLRPYLVIEYGFVAEPLPLDTPPTDDPPPADDPPPTDEPPADEPPTDEPPVDAPIPTGECHPKGVTQYCYEGYACNQGNLVGYYARTNDDGDPAVDCEQEGTVCCKPPEGVTYDDDFSGGGGGDDDDDGIGAAGDDEGDAIGCPVGNIGVGWNRVGSTDKYQHFEVVNEEGTGNSQKIESQNEGVGIKQAISITGDTKVYTIKADVYVEKGSMAMQIEGVNAEGFSETKAVDAEEGIQTTLEYEISDISTFNPTEVRFIATEPNTKFTVDEVGVVGEEKEEHGTETFVCGAEGYDDGGTSTREVAGYYAGLEVRSLGPEYIPIHAVSYKQIQPVVYLAGNFEPYKDHFEDEISIALIDMKDVFGREVDGFQVDILPINTIVGETFLTPSCVNLSYPVSEECDVERVGLVYDAEQSVSGSEDKLVLLFIPGGLFPGAAGMYMQYSHVAWTLSVPGTEPFGLETSPEYVADVMAHEVGHAMGLSHSYSPSIMGGGLGSEFFDTLDWPEKALICNAPLNTGINVDCLQYSNEGINNLQQENVALNLRLSCVGGGTPPIPFLGHIDMCTTWVSGVCPIPKTALQEGRYSGTPYVDFSNTHYWFRLYDEDNQPVNFWVGPRYNFVRGRKAPESKEICPEYGSEGTCQETNNFELKILPRDEYCPTLESFDFEMTGKIMCDGHPFPSYPLEAHLDVTLHGGINDIKNTVIVHRDSSVFSFMPFEVTPESYWSLSVGYESPNIYRKGFFADSMVIGEDYPYSRMVELTVLGGVYDSTSMLLDVGKCPPVWPSSDTFALAGSVTCNNVLFNAREVAVFIDESPSYWRHYDYVDGMSKYMIPDIPYVQGALYTIHLVLYDPFTFGIEEVVAEAISRQTLRNVATGELIDMSNFVYNFDKCELKAINPTVTFTSNKSRMHLGESATLIWDTTDADTCTASGAWSGAKATSGSQVVTPQSLGNKTYTLTCTNNNGGSASSSVTVNVQEKPSSTIKGTLHCDNVGTPATGTNIQVRDETQKVVGETNVVAGDGQTVSYRVTTQNVNLMDGRMYNIRPTGFGPNTGGTYECVQKHPSKNELWAKRNMPQVGGSCTITTNPFMCPVEIGDNSGECWQVLDLNNVNFYATSCGGSENPINLPSCRGNDFGTNRNILDMNKSPPTPVAEEDNLKVCFYSKKASIPEGFAIYHNRTLDLKVFDESHTNKTYKPQNPDYNTGKSSNSLVCAKIPLSELTGYDTFKAFPYSKKGEAGQYNTCTQDVGYSYVSPKPTVSNVQLSSVFQGLGLSHPDSWVNITWDYSEPTGPIEYYVNRLYDFGSDGSASYQTIATIKPGTDDYNNRTYTDRGIPVNEEYAYEIVPAVLTDSMPEQSDKFMVYQPLGFAGRTIGGSECRITGWARDQDTPTESTDIHVYADGTWRDGTFIAGDPADKYRSDLENAFGGEEYAYHGFDVRLDGSVVDGECHPLYAYVLNAEGTKGWSQSVNRNSNPAKSIGCSEYSTWEEVEAAHPEWKDATAVIRCDAPSGAVGSGAVILDTVVEEVENAAHDIVGSPVTPPPEDEGEGAEVEPEEDSWGINILKTLGF